MVETDAPFLTPHPHRGKRNEPYALPYTVRALAAIGARTCDELCADVSLTTRTVCTVCPFHSSCTAGGGCWPPDRTQ